MSLLSKDSQTSMMKRIAKDSKEGFPWQHALERIQNFPLLPKTQFLLFFVCLFLVSSLSRPRPPPPPHPRQSCVKGRQECESSWFWTWFWTTEPDHFQLPEVVEYLRHMIWPLLGPELATSCDGLHHLLSEKQTLLDMFRIRACC